MPTPTSERCQTCGNEQRNGRKYLTSRMGMYGGGVQEYVRCNNKWHDAKEPSREEESDADSD
jgi:hypothetical protein